MNTPPEHTCRVTIDPGGPLVLEGPVEVTLGNDTVARSERPVVAVCTCRRSRRYPWCDTSHRHRRRAPLPGASGTKGPAADGGSE